MSHPTRKFNPSGPSRLDLPGAVKNTAKSSMLASPCPPLAVDVGTTSRDIEDAVRPLSAPPNASDGSAVASGSSLSFTNEDLRRELLASLSGLNFAFGEQQSAEGDCTQQGLPQAPTFMTDSLKRKAAAVDNALDALEREVLKRSRPFNADTSVGEHSLMPALTSSLGSISKSPALASVTQTPANPGEISLDDILDTNAFVCPSPPPQTPVGLTDDEDDAGDKKTPTSSKVAGTAQKHTSLSMSAFDLPSRWDKIPINIFRRSRDMASRRPGHDLELIANGGDINAVINSTRVGRAIVNSTLLTQHTLNALKNSVAAEDLGDLSDLSDFGYYRQHRLQREKRKNRRKASSLARQFHLINKNEQLPLEA
ncbi:hypothetical protein EV182_006227, partial [Spiromyces aspiralis]